MNKIHFIALLFILILSSTISSGQKFDSYILHPPKKQLDGVHKIAVLNFEGQHDLGQQIVDYMNQYLLQEKRGLQGRTFMEEARTNIFQVVEREELSRILKEQKLGMTGVLDENTTQEVGRILGVDAIVSGSIIYDSKDESKTYSYKKKDGSTVNSYCTIRKVVGKSNIKIVSIKTGELLGTVNSTRTVQDKKCDKERSNLISSSSLAGEACRYLAWDMVAYFAPTFVREVFKMEKLKSKEYRDKSKLVTDYLKNDQIKDAYIVYKSLYDQDPYFPAIIYNLGSIYEAYGAFDKAKDYYEKAYNLDKTNNKYFDGLERALNGINLLKIYEDMGIHLSFPDLDGFASNSANTLTVTGSIKDSYSTYESPSTHSNVVAKIRGGLNFSILAIEGNWVLIDLMDGKQGYLQKEYTTDINFDSNKN